MQGFFKRENCVFLILTILLCTVKFVTAGAEEPPQAPAEETFFSSDSPVEITSERMTALTKQRKAVFEGSVKVVQGTTTMTTDWMEVTYSEKGDIVEIRAKGQVVIRQNDREIQSGELHYSRLEDMIIFTGNPVAREGANTVQGTRMVYHLKDGRSEVENSRVLIKKEISNAGQ
ncbi:MAG: hypothetical protein D6726_10265 [Nitrospirae bacterium]|nr:MAG: hypothetical protein D6726_10265 [Nitrospirota bacterium]